MKTILTSLLLGLIMGLVPRSATAQTAPAQMNYQGRLVNSNGIPLASGDYSLSFRILDARTNGSLIWGPQIFNGAAGPGFGPLVSVMQGWFNLPLGPIDTNSRALRSAFSGTNRFIEVQLGTNPPFVPRQQILTTPFAFLAATVPDASITSTKLAYAAVGSNQLAPQAVRSSNIATGAVGRIQLAPLAVQSSNLANGAVGSVQLKSNAVQSYHIAPAAVGSAQLAPGAVGATHLAAGLGSKVFTNSGLFVVPQGVNFLFVSLVGGGGGGGAGDQEPGGFGGDNFGGGGGGGGGIVLDYPVLVTPGTTFAVAIGAGGAGAPSGAAGGSPPWSGYAGGAGGTTDFGGLISAQGGSPGTGGSGINEGGGGAGGAGGSTSIIAPLFNLGYAGNSGASRGGNNSFLGGSGATSPFGNGGAGGSGANANGVDGQGFGSGGGGGAPTNGTTGKGGAGGPGLALIRY